MTHWICEPQYCGVWHDAFRLLYDSFIAVYMWHDRLICVSWLIYVCDMTHSYVWHDRLICVWSCIYGVWYDSFIRVTWLIHVQYVSGSCAVCDMTRLGRGMDYLHVWHDSCIWVTWLIHAYDVTHLYVWHDACIRVTWLIYICDMTHLYMWHDPFIYMWHESLTYLHMWHDSFICEMTHSCVLYKSFIYAKWLIHAYDVTHLYMWRANSYVWHDSFVCVTEILHICVRWLLHIRDSFMNVTWLIHVFDVTHLCVTSLAYSVT